MKLCAPANDLLFQLYSFGVLTQPDTEAVCKRAYPVDNKGNSKFTIQKINRLIKIDKKCSVGSSTLINFRHPPQIKDFD